MSELKDILLAQKKKIQADMERAMEPFEAKLQEVNKALDAIGVPRQQELGLPKTTNSGWPIKKSISQQIIEILSKNNVGLKSPEIADRLRSGYGRRNLSNQNVSWYLSKLKKDEEVTLEGEGIWKITR
ncbi:MAG: hypothetical protein K8R48_07670 [Alphaproteobacteria bacterium]|nr:hypothetical protein [Alphaproteobacteria bacterium]